MASMMDSLLGMVLPAHLTLDGGSGKVVFAWTNVRGGQEGSNSSAAVGQGVEIDAGRGDVHKSSRIPSSSTIPALASVFQCCWDQAMSSSGTSFIKTPCLCSGAPSPPPLPVSSDSPRNPSLSRLQQSSSTITSGVSSWVPADGGFVTFSGPFHEKKDVMEVPLTFNLSFSTFSQPCCSRSLCK